MESPDALLPARPEIVSALPRYAQWAVALTLALTCCAGATAALSRTLAYSAKDYRADLSPPRRTNRRLLAHSWEHVDMKSDVLQYRFTVPAPPEVVVSHLMEPASYVGLNEYVFAVRDAREENGAITYTAIERLPFLGLHFHSAIKVRVRSEEGGTRFVMEVASRGGVRVHIATDFAAVPEGALADDTITLTAAAPVRAYARKHARAGQLHKARTLAARLA